MTKPSRDFWLAIGLFVVLAILTATTAVWQTRQEAAPPPLASFSSAPDGSRALWLWLGELGYVVSDEVLDQFWIPENTSLVFILEPSTPILAGEWEMIDTWVEDGGVLVLAGDQWGIAQATRHYNFNLAYLEAETPVLNAQTPMLVSPPLTGPASIRPRAYFRTDRDDFVTHLAVGPRPVLLSFQHGSGLVILSAAPFPFSNVGLKEAGNPSLVLNIIATGGQSGRIWFDEWHHGVRLGNVEIVGPANWLRSTPAGRSLLFAAVIIYVALVLRGKRFGRPVPPPQALSRRAPLEYITAIANLSRRAGHRSAVLSQYQHQIKRGLGQRYRLNPTLSDDEYLAQLTTFNPNFDVDALGDLLARLRQPHVSEHDLVQLAADVADWLKET